MFSSSVLGRNVGRAPDPVKPMSCRFSQFPGRRAYPARVSLRAWSSRVGGVRVRSALSAAFVVAAAVGLAGVGLVYTARQTLTGSVDDSALERAGQVTEAIQSGDPGIIRQTLRPAPGDQTVVQILDG